MRSVSAKLCSQQLTNTQAIQWTSAVLSMPRELSLNPAKRDRKWWGVLAFLPLSPPAFRLHFRFHPARLEALGRSAQGFGQGLG